MASLSMPRLAPEAAAGTARGPLPGRAVPAGIVRRAMAVRPSRAMAMAMRCCPRMSVVLRSSPAPRAGFGSAAPARGAEVKTGAAAAAAAPVAEPEPPTGWKGANLQGAMIAIGVGLVIRFLIPCPAGIPMQGWSLFSIFVSTIVGLVMEPMPTGAWAMLGVSVAIVTKTLTFGQAFGAFCNDVIWLIVASFFFAKGLEKTGLGNRVAQMFVKLLGKSTMGLAYGLTMAETAICPAMPSTSARAGGIFMPIIKSLAEAVGSLPGKTANKMGAYLIACQMQASNASSTLFLTGAAQNLLCLKLAAELGAVVSNPWMAWFKAASVPCLVMLAITPWLVFKLAPPELQDTPEAPGRAEEALTEMGPMSTDEKIMAGTMLGAVLLWVSGDAIGMAPVTAALLGLCTLLFTGVLEWQDCLRNTAAWDTLTWFAILVGMSGQLNGMGVITCFADAAGSVLQSLSMGWPAVFGVLHVFYFVIHYMFASQTAHVGALYSAFIAMMLASGVPPVLAALSLAFNTNLFGVITHYSSGQAAVFCGAGYLQLKDVFRIGAIFSAFNAVLWATVGMAWWKVVGLY
eukprot:CAMPEP_0117693140 /NCGR_PEP_ID=MMETSP0804-20121206/26717_1 /TAXON_ID=1074897 /ORGANISM="Tetraselmis astigmatica, Strain CCMP880" /LENGTH=571 /DNA_ID=CAMNT_0005506665 /DNA_START=298 /DNA_END=2013 /DNA_ORIENTATION=+